MLQSKLIPCPMSTSDSCFVVLENGRMDVFDSRLLRGKNQVIIELLGFSQTNAQEVMLSITGQGDIVEN